MTEVLIVVCLAIVAITAIVAMTKDDEVARNAINALVKLVRF